MKTLQTLLLSTLILASLTTASFASPLHTAYLVAPLPSYQTDHWEVSIPGWYLHNQHLQAGNIQNISMLYKPDSGIVIISIFIAGVTTGDNLTEIGQVGKIHNLEMPSNAWQQDSDGNYVCKASAAQGLTNFCPLPSN